MSNLRKSKWRPYLFSELFRERSGEGEEAETIPLKNRLEFLQKLGFVQGVLKKLSTEADVSVGQLLGRLVYSAMRRTSFADTNCNNYNSYLHFRITLISSYLLHLDYNHFYSFGKNEKPQPQFPGFLASVKEALDNVIFGALAVAALIALLTGTISHGWDGMVEGISIYVGIIIIVSFTSVNDYFKDKNLVKLASDVKRDKIGVIRGKKGVTQTISIYQLVVGDIILIEPGCMIPADCLLINGEGILINETRYSEDRAGKRKTAAYEENISQYPDPFLMSNTFVNVGSGRAVVCCVGKNSRRGTLDDKIDTDSKTELQKKLDILS
jgi:magnesium-transporting ATPase (P-type)